MKNFDFAVSAAQTCTYIVDEIASFGNPSLDSTAHIPISFYHENCKNSTSNYTLNPLQDKQFGFFTASPTARPRPPWKELNTAIERCDLTACLEIIERVFPGCDPLQVLRDWQGFGGEDA